MQQLKISSDLMANQLILDHSREIVSHELFILIYPLVIVDIFYLSIEREVVPLRHNCLKILVLDFKEKQH